MRNFIIISGILFLLGGCSEESRVASLFKEQYGVGHEHEKVTGVYVYPTKKKHRYKIEYATEWPTYTVFCQPESVHIIPVGTTKDLAGNYNSVEVECKCVRTHCCQECEPPLYYTSPDGRHFCQKYREKYLLEHGHVCAHPCKGHVIKAGSTTDVARAYLGPDGKLYIE